MTYNSTMVQALKKLVRIQPGGRVELVAPELPAGREAEVIVLVTPEEQAGSLFGLFADDPSLLDEIVEESMSARSRPLRTHDEQSRP